MPLHVLTQQRAKDVRRLGSIANHLIPAASESVGNPHPSVGEKEDEVFGMLPLLRWADIMEHNTEDDLWIVVAGRVWDMTGFIASDHPGGSEIPTEYGGKDASDFWYEIHGHLEQEIIEDLLAGEGFNTGLDGNTLPKLVGLCADDPPPKAMGTAGYERYVTRNWAGTVRWQHKGQQPSFYEPSNVEEVQELVRTHSKVRVLGKGHCFPALCDGGGADGEVVISLLGKMSGVVCVDQEAKTVTVPIPIKVYCLCVYSVAFCVSALLDLYFPGGAGAGRDNLLSAHQVSSRRDRPRLAYGCISSAHDYRWLCSYRLAWLLRH